MSRPEAPERDGELDEKEPAEEKSPAAQEEASEADEALLELGELRRLISDRDRDRGRFTTSGVALHDSEMKADAVAGRDQYFISLTGSQRGRARAHVLPKVSLDRVRDVNVGHPSADRVSEVLRQQNIVVLHGPPRTGRGFLAQAAAAEMFVSEGRCSILGPDTRVYDLTEEDFTSRHTYVLEVGSEWPTAPFELTRLAQVLATAHSYLVLIVDDSRLTPESLAQWTVKVMDGPDRATVLRRHAELSVPQDQSAALAKALADPGVGAWLESRPAFARVVWFAELMVQVASGQTTIEACLAQTETEGARRALEIIGDKNAPREMAISIALFGGLPYSTVKSVSDRLADVAHAMEMPESVRPRPFLRFRDEQLGSIDARISDGTAHTNFGTHRAEVVDFDRPGLASAIIDCAWREYDGSTPLKEWLSGLVRHETEAIRTRAALAVGRFCFLDFVQVVETVLFPWSKSTSPDARLGAALALSVAIREQSMAAHVIDLVRSWSDDSNRNRRMTAGLAWGLAVCPEYPAEGLAGIEALMSDQEPSVNVAARSGLLAAFAGGLSRSVLGAVDAWADGRSSADRRELNSVFLELCEVRGLVDLPETRFWPVTLWCFHQSSRRRAPDQSEQVSGETHRTVVDLWRSALNDSSTAVQALEVLTDWLRIADARSDVKEAVLDLFERLPNTQNDLRRLKHHLENLALVSEPSETGRQAYEELVRAHYTDEVGEEL